MVVEGASSMAAAFQPARLHNGVNLIEANGKSCTHEVAWPADAEAPSHAPPAPRPGPPAREYPFRIDPFQQTAINCLEAGHSVLVAAHTSAGKTVVAEYAFAMALRDKQRVVYTSPLKALSNQKYRELYEEFQDVGLMTGDVTINPNASCLVMTTEILRSMLYRGSSVVREVQLLVYDEIHYLRDAERGVVWEETIILAPKTARFAFLSATIPNALEFAEWIAKVHSSPCHVVYTEYRPTPLQHYMFPTGGDGLYLVVDERGNFRDDNFQKAVAALQAAAEEGPKRKKGSKELKDTRQGERSDIFQLVRLIMERHYDPVIVFSFSKRECEALALQMVSLDLTTDTEKKLIEAIYNNALECLSDDDRRLPQLVNMLPSLQRGIGVHHSGLLPILKEVIELLFGEGLLKVLFATDTFSTGLNMPAKTVVFTSPRKFDGGSFRWLSSGEYIQMSGRAGRRGLDDKGIVMLMLDTKMEPAVAKSMVRGAPDNLYSAFHLSYRMLLNLLRSEFVAPEDIMRSSYRQFQLQRSLPQLQANLEALQLQHEQCTVPDEVSTAQYALLHQQLRELQRDLRERLTSPVHALPFIQPGRLLRVVTSEDGSLGEPSTSQPAGTMDFSALDAPGVWGLAVNFERVAAEVNGNDDAADASQPEDKRERKRRKKRHGSYLVDVLVNVTPESVDGGGGGGGQSSRGRMPVLRSVQAQDCTAAVLAVPLSAVDKMSSIRVYIPQDLRPQEARKLAAKAAGEVLQRCGKEVPLLDPEQDMKVQDDKVRKLHRKLETVEKGLLAHPLNTLTLEDKRGRVQAWQHKQDLEEQIKQAKRELRAATSLVYKEELGCRKRVLRRLGHVTEEDIITMKGRAAAELSLGDELVLGDMLMGGAFKDCNVEQLAALLSCFVWRERREGAASKVRQDLQPLYNTVRETARRTAKVAVECKMPLDVEEYVNSFCPDLMDAAASWARGDRFADVLKMSSVFEGSLVRAIRREVELLAELGSAAKVLGDVDLAGTLDRAVQRMKRDIIFAASLYL